MSNDDAGRVWRMADLVTPMAIRAAATLGIPDALAAGSRDAAEVAAEVGAHADSVERVLRHLATSGVVVGHPGGLFELTALGETLCQDHPSGLRGRLDVSEATGRADLALVQLVHSIRTGEESYSLQFGRTFWEDLAEHVELTGPYDRQMGLDIGADAAAIVSAYDWGTLGSVVDVGGGNGTLLAALLTAFPNLQGIVVDQPATVAAARELLDAAGLGDRARVVGGSFFEALPAGEGGYVLSAIIHDWDDAAATNILQRCRDAAGAAPTFVIEKIGAEGDAPRTDMDLRVLVYMAGKERTVDQLRELAGGAGLRVEKVHPAGPLAILELRTL